MEMLLSEGVKARDAYVKKLREKISGMVESSVGIVIFAEPCGHGLSRKLTIHKDTNDRVSKKLWYYRYTFQ